MTSKQNLMFHFDAVNAYESRQYQHALGLFGRVQEPSAVILFNIASCHLNIGNISMAIKEYKKCVAKDSYMVVGYFQLATAYVKSEEYASAMENFQKALQSLRGHDFIDYKQLHMSAKVYASEIYYNIALLHIFNANTVEAAHTLNLALEKNTVATFRTQIEDAVNNLDNDNWGYFGNTPEEKLTYFPTGAIFRPNKSKLEGIQSSTNFMDTAKVLSASKEEYSFVGFVGAAKQQAAVGKPRRPSPPNTAPPPVPDGPPPRLPPNQFAPIRPHNPDHVTKTPIRPAPSKPPSRFSPNSPARSSPQLISQGARSPAYKSVDHNKEKTSKPKPPLPPAPAFPPNSQQKINVTFNCTLSISSNSSFTDFTRIVTSQLQSISDDLERNNRVTMEIGYGGNTLDQSSWTSFLKSRNKQDIIVKQQSSTVVDEAIYHE